MNKKLLTVLFNDKEENGRAEVRLQWWNDSASTWKDIAIAVPNPDQFPDGNLSVSVKQSVYLKKSKPVFFGHYWFSGQPLVSCQLDLTSTLLSLKNLTVHS
jgi:hypothetical protein